MRIEKRGRWTHSCHNLSRSGVPYSTVGMHTSLKIILKPKKAEKMRWKKQIISILGTTSNM
jgi:hypothetical protein